MDDHRRGASGHLHDSTQFPVYNVVYVTQTVTPAGTVQASYYRRVPGRIYRRCGAWRHRRSGNGYYYPPYVVWAGDRIPFITLADALWLQHL